MTMKRQSIICFSLGLMLALLISPAVGYGREQAPDPRSDKTNELDIGVCAPNAGPFSTRITNPYFPLPEETVWVLRGVEDGVNVRLRITVLEKTEVVAGVRTRVVEERAWEDGELHEVALNYFVQAPDGTVCYYGEDVNFYEDGQVVSHEGAWRAGVGANRPGIIMPANPAVGMSYAQEVAPGISEDRAEIIAMGESVRLRAGTYRNTLLTRETSPLDPEAVSFKHYAPRVGLIVDEPIELVRMVRDD
jgi:hypothetical protein